jgi:hypothetical protein
MTKAQEGWERAAKYSERAQGATDEETRQLFTCCARPCGSVRASGSIIDGPGHKSGAIASRPAHDHWMNSPNSGLIQPTIHL